MGSAFSMFPVMDDTMEAKLNFSCPITTFEYTLDSHRQPLGYKPISGEGNFVTVKIDDEKGAWYPDGHDFILKKSIVIEHPEILFGKDGVAGLNSIIGLALRWTDVKAEQRGIKHICDIKRLQGRIVQTFELHFPENLVRGSVTCETIIYLKKIGPQLPGEKHLCNEPGVVLGILDSWTIFVDGSGSSFPISVISDSDGPLWDVYFNTGCDCLSDDFSEENVCIRLNSAHKDYALLKTNSAPSESILLSEVLSAAMSVIIYTVKDEIGADWDLVMNGEGYEEGSIARAVHYFIKNIGWDTQSPATLSLSIRNYFAANFKEQ